MQTAKVTFKGQITIPKTVREALNIVEGDSVMLKIEGDHAILRPIKKKPLLEFFGAFPATKPYPGTESVREKAWRRTFFQGQAMKRAFIDANVILVYFTQDPPELAEAARKTFSALQPRKDSLSWSWRLSQ